MSLPIGVFDSGTGGLAVLEEILKLDLFDNQSSDRLPQGDGKPDFGRERFVFLADQANMPYGNYAIVGKVGFLSEVIRNDAFSCLAGSISPRARPRRRGRANGRSRPWLSPANTATAYGKADLESLVAKAGLPIPVIGVVDAGRPGRVGDYCRACGRHDRRAGHQRQPWRRGVSGRD